MLEAEGVTAQAVQTHCAAHGYDMRIFQMSVYLSKNEKGRRQAVPAK